MSPAVVDFSSSESKQPQSVQSSNPNPPSSKFSDSQNLQFNSSFSTESISSTSFEFSSAINSGFDCSFSSASVSGRSKPRLVKLRKRSGSGKSSTTSVPEQNCSGFNPFRKGSEYSHGAEGADRSNTTTGDFSASSDNNKVGKFDNNGVFLFGANRSGLRFNSSSGQQEQAGSGEFKILDNLSFHFGVNNGRSASHLNSESEFLVFGNRGQLGANESGDGVVPCFSFGAHKGDSVTHSSLKPRESDVNAGKLRANDCMRASNGGFMFGDNKSTLPMNFNLDKEGCSGSRGLNSDQFGKSGILDFVFGVNKNNLKDKQSSESERKLNFNEFELSGEPGLVFGSSKNFSETEKGSENMENCKNQKGKVEKEYTTSFRKLDRVDFVFDADHRDRVSDSESVKKEFTANFVKSVPNLGRNVKEDSNEVSEKLNLQDFVFGADCASSSFNEGIKVVYNVNRSNNEKAENRHDFVKMPNKKMGSDVNFENQYVSRSCSTLDGASGRSPVFGLSEDLRSFNINDSESAEKNRGSFGNASNVFVFGRNGKLSDFSIGIAGSTNPDQPGDENLGSLGDGSPVRNNGGVGNSINSDSEFTFGNNENTSVAHGGSVENIMSGEFRNKDIRSGMNVFNELINFSCFSCGTFGNENRPINLNDGGQLHQDQSDNLTDECKASFLSSFTSAGYGFPPNNGVSDSPSTDRTERKGEKDEPNLKSTPVGVGPSVTDFSTPGLDLPHMFTANLFSDLSDKLNVGRNSRSVRNTRLRKTRGKPRQHTVVQPLGRHDSFLQQNGDSPGCSSPMDFSPYGDTTRAKDENLAAEREHVISEGDKNCRGPSEKAFGDHGGINGYPQNKLSFGAGVEHLKPEQARVDLSGVASAQAGPGLCSHSQKDESECEKHSFSGSTLGSFGENTFTCSASSAGQDSLSAIRRQYRQKYKMRIGQGPTPPISNQKVEFASLHKVQIQKGVSSNTHSKSEHIFKADDHSENGLTKATAEDVCEKLRIRGNEAYKNGDLSKAEDFYTKGILSVPHMEASGCCIEPLMLCYSNRAATRMSLGMVRDALQDCAKAAALSPSFLKVQIRAAKCHLLLGEVENALAYFRNCLESASSVCLDRRITVEAADGLHKAQKVAKCTNQSAELLREKTFDAVTSALGIITEALSISPHSEKLLEMKGEALCMLRKYDEVIQLCEQTLDFAQKNFGILVSHSGSESENFSLTMWRWRLMSEANYRLGKLEVVLDIIKKQENIRSSRSANMIQEPAISLAVNVRELLAHKKAGNEAYKAGKHAEAVEHYTAAISRSVESRPFSAICFCNRAAAYQALGQIADAIADCSLAMALDANYSKAASRRATLHETIRDYKQAASDIQRQISILENQSEERVQQSDTPEGPASSVKDLRQVYRRLSLMEEKAKRGIPLDLYLILGIKASDNAAEIKKAYRRAALRHHPDKASQFLARSESGDEGRLWKEIAEEVHKDADRLFKMIGEAYAILSDPAKRSKYDLEEETRKAKDGNRSSSSGKSYEYYSSPFEKSTSGRYSSQYGRSRRQYWRESWKTHGNSSSRW